MLVLTMMVRDEADIVAATIEHHLAHGVDHVIVTDNASVDGTTEILEHYAQSAPLTLLHDPEHRKQQGEVVTRMARQAHEMGATWVVNGDADELLVPVAPGARLADVFAALDTSIGAFTVPVTNLIGPIARSGAGLGRLVLRDERSLERLRSLGVHAHPTPNAIHVATADVEVAQGNHYVSIPQDGDVPDELALEVLHLPWRSIAQFERKTENMGRGYDASPTLDPSPNHHGMRDWRRLQGGILTPFLARRMPTSAELASDDLPTDERGVHGLRALGDAAVRPELLAAALTDGEIVSDEEMLAERAVAERVAPYEHVLLDRLMGARLHTDGLSKRLAESEAERSRMVDEVLAVRTMLDTVGVERDERAAELQAANERLAHVEASRIGRYVLRSLDS